MLSENGEMSSGTASEAPDLLDIGRSDAVRCQRVRHSDCNSCQTDALREKGLYDIVHSSSVWFIQQRFADP